MRLSLSTAALTSVFAVGIAAIPAIAQIDLVGTWTGEGTTINNYGRNRASKVIKILSVEDNTIEAEATWTHEGTTGNTPSGEAVSTDTESLIGAINATGDVFYLVETEETGIYHGRVIDEDTIEVFLTQPGEFPVANYRIFKRVEE